MITLNGAYLYAFYCACVQVLQMVVCVAHNIILCTHRRCMQMCSVASIEMHWSSIYNIMHILALHIVLYGVI